MSLYPTVTNVLRPKYNTDDYGTHEDDFGVGGLRSVQSVSDLNNIPTKRRKAYMVVNVRNYNGSPRPFWLASPDNSESNLSNNSFWVPVPYDDWITSSVGGGYTYMGDFDASTGQITSGVNNGTSLANNPLSPPNTNNGDYYKAVVAGTYDFGAGNVTFAVGDKAIWNGSTWELDAIGSTNTDWNNITNMPQIISDIGDGIFVPVSQTDFNNLQTTVNSNTNKLNTLNLGSGTDLSLMSDSDIITKLIITTNFYTKTEVDSIQTTLQNNIDAIIDDTATAVDTVVGNFTKYVGYTNSTYSSSKIESRLLDVYNAAIQDGQGNVYANFGMVTGTFDGTTLSIDLGVKTDKILPPIVGNISQTLTTGYTIDNSGNTTIINFAGSPSQFQGEKYEIHYVVGIGNANETDPIFTASAAYGISTTNIINWNQAYNKYVVSGTLSGTDLVLTTRDGNNLSPIDLSSLGGGGTSINISQDYISKGDYTSSNLTESRIYDDGSNIGFNTTDFSDSSLMRAVLSGGSTNTIFTIETSNRGDVLRLVKPNNYEYHIKATTSDIDVFSVRADGETVVDKIRVNNPSVLNYINAKVVFYDENTNEFAVHSNFGLERILEIDNTALGSSGTVKSWTVTDVGSDKVVYTDSSQTLMGASLNGMLLNSGILSIGGNYSSTIAFNSTNSSSFIINSRNSSTLIDYKGTVNISDSQISRSVTNYLNPSVDNSKSSIEEIITSASYQVLKTDDNSVSTVKLGISFDYVYIGGTNYSGLKYYDLPSSWGTIDSNNTIIPSIGWVVDYVAGSGAYNFSNGIVENSGNVTLGGNITTINITNDISVNPSFNLNFRTDNTTYNIAELGNFSFRDNGVTLKYTRYNDIVSGNYDYKSELVIDATQAVLGFWSYANWNGSRIRILRSDPSIIDISPYDTATGAYTVLKYDLDYRDYWGVINNTNTAIPHIGWVVDYVTSAIGIDRTFSNGITEDANRNVSLGGSFTSTVDIYSTTGHTFQIRSEDSQYKIKTELTTFYWGATTSVNAVDYTRGHGVQVTKDFSRLFSYDFNASMSAEVYVSGGTITFRENYTETAPFSGAKYGNDYSGNWGTINGTNRYIPDIGWVVNYVAANTSDISAGDGLTRIGDVINLGGSFSSDTLINSSTANYLQLYSSYSDSSGNSYFKVEPSKTSMYSGYGASYSYIYVNGLFGINLTVGSNTSYITSTQFIFGSLASYPQNFSPSWGTIDSSNKNVPSIGWVYDHVSNLIKKNILTVTQAITSSYTDFGTIVKNDANSDCLLLFTFDKSASLSALIDVELRVGAQVQYSFTLIGNSLESTTTNNQVITAFISGTIGAGTFNVYMKTGNTGNGQLLEIRVIEIN